MKIIKGHGFIVHKTELLGIIVLAVIVWLIGAWTIAGWVRALF